MKINSILSTFFLLLFIFTSSSVTVAFMTISHGKFGNAFIYLAVTLLWLIIAATIFILLRKYTKNAKISKLVTPNRVYAFCSIVMLILQIYLVFELRYKPVHDSLYVDTAARNFAYDGNFENMYNGIEHKSKYFSRFPNNWGILLLLSFIYRIVFLIFGRVPYMTTKMLNIILIQISVFFMFLTAKLIFKDKPRQIFSAVFAAIMPVFYLYTPIFYTDTLTMPFVIAAVYCFLRSIKAKSRKSAVLWTISSALLVGVGYTFKGSLCVILVALVIYGFMKKKALSAFLSAVSLVTALVLCNMLVFNLGLAMGISTPQKLERERIPTVHWVMMSLVGNGGFNVEEYRYTISFKSYDEKKAANIERIKQHISDYTPRGFIDHLVEKSNFTWNSGKYYAVHHLDDCKKSSLHTMIKSGRLFRIYCDTVHLLMILLMLFSFIGGAMKKRCTPMFLIRLAVFGLTLFLLIWETRSRYLVNFLPLFILMSADGMRFFCAWILKLKKRISSCRA